MDSALGPDLTLRFPFHVERFADIPVDQDDVPVTTEPTLRLFAVRHQPRDRAARSW